MQIPADLKGKTALITGTNRGIGKALLEAFCLAGCSVISLSRQKEEAHLELLKELSVKHQVEIFPYYADLSDEAALKQTLRDICSAHKKIDILINNAGTAFGASALMTPISKLKDLFSVNFYAPVQIMQTISRLMLRAGSGSIINIASVGGIECRPGYLAYGSSKCALIYASRCLALELGQNGVRVNAIAPGLIDTSMGHYKNSDELALTVSRTALRKMGSVNDVVSAALYLASDSAAFVTGEVLRVDGGRY